MEDVDLRSTDNTNADPDTRAVWVKLAQRLNVPIQCVLFTASAKLCEHNDTVRALNLGPEVSFSTFYKQCMDTRVASLFLGRYTTPNEAVGDCGERLEGNCDEMEKFPVLIDYTDQSREPDYSTANGLHWLRF
jgi:hypothetical protein